jgi:hypothetical protein
LLSLGPYRRSLEYLKNWTPTATQSVGDR